MPKDYDLIMIGAGSAGLTAVEAATRIGMKVALVEKNRIGGDCTRTGCVPSKALLRVARAMRPYPTYSSAIQLMAVEAVMERYFSGFMGRVARVLASAG